MKINIKNKYFRTAFELLGNILSIPLSLLLFLLFLLLGLFMPIIAIGLLELAFKNKQSYKEIRDDVAKSELVEYFRSLMV